MEYLRGERNEEGGRKGGREGGREGGRGGGGGETVINVVVIMYM